MALHKLRCTLQCLVLATLLLFSFSLPADVFVVTGAKNSSITLSKNQISDVFLGKVTSLPDGSNATPIDQSESSPLRNEFYSKVSNKSTNQAKAHWAQLYFTGRGTPPREVSSSSDVKKIVNSTPGAIGYIEESAVDSSVKIIFIAQ
jgi:ABC-type phosphate transport system substrate-binding protein